MKEVQTACGNCWFCYNGQCTYAEDCYGSKKWSNTLNNFVPTTYIEREDLNWEETKMTDKEQKSNYNEPEYTGNDWANERLATDKELDNEEIDFINGEHLVQGWDYE